MSNRHCLFVNNMSKSVKVYEKQLKYYDDMILFYMQLLKTFSEIIQIVQKVIQCLLIIKKTTYFTYSSSNIVSSNLFCSALSNM